MATMAIIDPKEATLGPVLILTVSWLRDIQDNRHSILIVVPHQTLICNG
jgi:hypothetical protein